MDLALSKVGRRYGAFPSPPNAKENGFPAHLIQRVSEFPVRASITGAIGAVKDQGQQGSCTAHGSTSLGERLYRQWKKTSPIFSPAYTYYLERQAENTLDQGDCGAQVVTSLSIPDGNPGGGGFGWCPEELMPYSDSDFSTAPNAAQIAAAKAYFGGAYHNIGNVIANIKSCILSNYSFVIGIAVYQSFEDPNTSSSGLIPFPNVNAEQPIGGHEMHAGLDYDDTIQCPGSPNPGAVLVQNSWGTSFGIARPAGGEKGFGWLSYDYLMSAILASDVRLGHLSKAW
jgi:C1A family cysteine protease